MESVSILLFLMKNEEKEKEKDQITFIFIFSRSKLSFLKSIDEKRFLASQYKEKLFFFYFS